MTTRLALIGCGAQGRHGHLEAYRRVIADGEAARVVAVCDRDRARAEEAAALSPGARVYDDYRELLERERPDAVSIATPPAFHREQTIAALRKGAHVLCEKPLAMNVAEAREMIAAAERAGRVLTMGLQQRYVPAARYLRDSVERGELGDVFHTRLWTGHVWRLPPSPHFLRSALAGGGVVAATLVHWLDVALWILGNPPVATVSAAAFAKAPRLKNPPPPFRDVPGGAGIVAASDVEDFAVGFFRFADGRTLAVEANWLQHPTSRRVGIQFLAELGVAEYMPLALRWDGDGVVVDRTPPGVASAPEEHYFVGVVRDFCRAARTGEPGVITGPQMIQVQAVVDAMYRSARLGHEVGVDHAAGTPSSSAAR
jgi:predicted dehydrogenase